MQQVEKGKVSRVKVFVGVIAFHFLLCLIKRERKKESERERERDIYFLRETERN